MMWFIYKMSVWHMHVYIVSEILMAKGLKIVFLMNIWDCYNRVFVTEFTKTVLNGTLCISRNTILKY